MTKVMNKIHIFSTPRSGTHYLESLISRTLDMPIIPTPFEERDDDNRPGSQELIDKINEFSAIDSMVYKTHPNWLYPIDESVNEFKYCNVPTDDMLPLIQNFSQVSDYTIGLIRLNIVDVALSFALAFHNWLSDPSEVGSFRPPYKNDTVTIPMDDFMVYCNKVLAIYELIIAQTEIKCDKIIYYEDLAFDSTDSMWAGIGPSEKMTMKEMPSAVQLQWTGTHAIPSSVKQAKSKKITIANYDELHEYATSFYTLEQPALTIVNGIITKIDLTNLIKGN